MLCSESYSLIFQNQLLHNQLSQIFKTCRDNYSAALKNERFTLERDDLLAHLKYALETCVQLPFDSLDFSLTEYKKASEYKDSYVFASFKPYAWLNKPSHINGVTANILSDLSTMVIDAGWLFLENLYSNSKKIDETLQDSNQKKYIVNIVSEVLYILVKKTLDRAHVNLMLAHQQLHEAQLPIEVIKFITLSYLAKADEGISEFITKSQQYCNRDLNDNTVFLLHKTLSLSRFLKANLAIKLSNYQEAYELIQECDEFNKTYRGFIIYDEPFLKFLHYTEMDSLLERIQKLQQEDSPLPASSVNSSDQEKKKKSRQKHKKKTMPTVVMPELQIEEPLPTKDNIVTTDNMIIASTCKQRTKEKKRLKKIEKNIQALNELTSPTDRIPACYNDTNAPLKIILDEISSIFTRFECEGYMFGSGNIKQNPSDFDIFIPNIKSAEDAERVKRLLDFFVLCGGVITQKNPITGEYGYRIGERHTIPMLWSNVQLDFTVSKQTNFISNALGTDFSVGALYYNFREKCMYQLNQLTSIADLDNKILNTISDPLQSFSEDPRRIFRGIRLMASEGFDFSSACRDAIKVLFLEKNLFKDNMTGGQLNHQLDLLFQSPVAIENITILTSLDLLDKIIECLDERQDQKARDYLNKLLPFVPVNNYSPGFFEHLNVSPIETQKNAHFFARYTYG